MPQSEKSILNETLVALSAEPDTLVYRQNTGTAWQGRPMEARIGSYVRIEPGMKILAEARPVSFGIPGAGDIVGVSHGRALQGETKTLTGRQREQQILFERAWVKAGGIYVLARSAEEMVEGVRKRLVSHS